VQHITQAVKLRQPEKSKLARWIRVSHEFQQISATRSCFSALVPHFPGQIRPLQLAVRAPESLGAAPHLNAGGFLLEAKK